MKAKQNARGNKKDASYRIRHGIRPGTYLFGPHNPSGAVEASGSCFLSTERVCSIFGLPQAQLP